MPTNDEKNRHDLKNQLAIIFGFSEMLLTEAAKDDPRRSDFDEIYKAAAAALDLIARVFPADADDTTGVAGLGTGFDGGISA